MQYIYSKEMLAAAAEDVSNPYLIHRFCICTTDSMCIYLSVCSIQYYSQKLHSTLEVTESKLQRYT